MIRTLFNLRLGESGVIKLINSPKNIKERLHSFGLIAGVKIIYYKDTPFGCPRVYRCLGTNIAIRNKVAKQIEIETYE